MANKVNQSPPVAAPIGLGSIVNIASYLLNLYQSLVGILRDYATTINSLVGEQTIPTIPELLISFPKASLPSASANKNALIVVSDDVGGLTPAFSDGTNWRRTADRNIIS